MDKLKIFAKTVEEEAMQQILDMSRCKAYHENTIRIMPDCHAGAGCTVGTVIAVDNRVVPNTVGVDIVAGCSSWNWRKTISICSCWIR